MNTRRVWPWVAIILGVAPCCAARAANIDCLRTAKVTDFGARGDEASDDTKAIQMALDAVDSGACLRFPAGIYMQGASLELKKQGVKLIGEEGAEIRATNWDDQSIQLKAANTGIYNVKLTAEVRDRQSMPRHQRIGVMADHVSVIGNHIIGGSAAGIFVYDATHYLIEGNEVEKTLADGIHSTGNTRWGKIIGNVVHDTGDDMISVVSYCCDASPVRDRQWATLGVVLDRAA